MKNILMTSLLSLVFSLVAFQTANAADVRYVICYDSNDTPLWQGQYYVLSQDKPGQPVLQIVERIENGKCILGPVFTVAAEACQGLAIHVYLNGQPCTP